MSALPLDPRFAPRMPLEPVNRNDPVADILAQQPFGAGIDPGVTPFVWGQGGAQLTPEDLARRRALADAQTQGDYSPVQHWTQGLGRALDGLLGGIETRKLNRIEGDMQAKRGTDIAALLGEGNADLAPALAGNDPVTTALAEQVFKSRMPKQSAPHYWETNDGSLGLVGPDGRPQILYQDPTPKVTTLALDNGDGTKTLVRVGPDGLPIGNNMQGGGGQASSGPDWTSAFSPEELRVMKAEAARRGGSANIPQGSPLQGGPQPGAVVDGYRFKGGNPNDQASWEAVR